MAKRRALKPDSTQQRGLGCIIYCRYSPRSSVNRDAAGDAESIVAQVAACRAYAGRQGWDVLAVRTDEFKTGGNTTGRDGLAEAVVEAKRAGAVLLVYKLERLSRNARDTLNICHDLKKGGAALASATESFDVHTPLGEAMMQMMATFNQLDLSKKSEITRDAMIGMQQRGRIVSSSAPFGWKHGKPFEIVRGTSRLTRWQMEPDESEQRVLARLRKLAASGITVYAVAKRLNDEGLAGRGGVKWCSVKVNRVLRRDREAGGVFDPCATA